MRESSKFFIVGSALTFIYGYIITQPEISSFQSLIVVLFIWPGMLIFQVVMYGLFSGYHSKIRYIMLNLTKGGVFLIQPLFVDINANYIITSISSIIILTIDYHVMKHFNRTGLSRNMSLQEIEKYKEMFKKQFALIAPSIMVFFTYNQLYKEFEVISIIIIMIFINVLYWELVLKKQVQKFKLYLIFFIGILAVWGISFWTTFEVVKAPFVICIMLIMYFLNKRVVRS